MLLIFYNKISKLLMINVCFLQKLLLLIYSHLQHDIHPSQEWIGDAWFHPHIGSNTGL